MHQQIITKPLTDLTNYAAAFILAVAHQAVAERGSFTMALAGGQSPRQLYTLLGQGVALNELQRWQLPVPAHAIAQDRLHLPQATWLFQSDERWVPSTHPDSNEHMIRETLLVSSPLQYNHFFAMNTSAATPQDAAFQYEQCLRLFFSTQKNLPSFDMMLLGMGSDGHTASLFPDDSEALHERTAWVIARNVLHGNPSGWRLTLTLPLLCNARKVLFFVPGHTKFEIVQRIVAGKEPMLPAAMVQVKNGSLYWFTSNE